MGASVVRRVARFISLDASTIAAIPPCVHVTSEPNVWVGSHVRYSPANGISCGKETSKYRLCHRTFISHSYGVVGVGLLGSEQVGSKIELSIWGCQGSAELSSQKWRLSDCNKGYGASGTFKAGDGEEAFFGFGRDLHGELIEFKLFEKSRVRASIVRGAAPQVWAINKTASEPTTASTQNDGASTIPAFTSACCRTAYRTKYADQLADHQSHKAFAVAPSGGCAWGMSWDRNDAINYAFGRCKQYGDGCLLYDFDGNPLTGLTEKQSQAWVSSKFGAAK